MFPALDIPADLAGLTLKDFLEKAAVMVTEPGQQLVDDWGPMQDVPENIQEVAAATGQVPVDWSGRCGMLGRGDGLLNKLIAAVESGSTKLAPDSVKITEG